MAIGYLSSRSTAAALQTIINLPLVLTLSVLPDIDLYLRYLLPFIYHRGATHSVFTAVSVSVPFFLIYGKKTSPYFMAYPSIDLSVITLQEANLEYNCSGLFQTVTSAQALISTAS